MNAPLFSPDGTEVDLGPYQPSDYERFIPEPAKNPGRTHFERDRARILHSSALRRLGAKTQVLGPSSDDFIRTRLTHSLEVAQVGRELGKALGCNPDVVDTACLAHDLGHPPFGHNGETALNQVAAEIGGFEGNAQTFRVLTRLEPKTIVGEQYSVGLNLTRASLDAVSKYPWPAGAAPQSKGGKDCPKFGVYEDDARIFSWVRTYDDAAGSAPGSAPGSAAGSHGTRRCIEAQVMDVSDDIGYSVHDVEDAVASGRAPLQAITNGSDAEAIIASTRRWYGTAISADDLGAALERLIGQQWWPRSYNGTHADLAALKNLTSQLIGRWCATIHRATREVHGPGPLIRFNADLVIPEHIAAEILILKGIAVHYVMAPREFEPVYLHQRTLLFDLVDVLASTGGKHLEGIHRAEYENASDDAARLRAVIDQVASLTDTSAGQWHARLCGLLSTQMD